MKRFFFVVVIGLATSSLFASNPKQQEARAVTAKTPALAKASPEEKKWSLTLSADLVGMYYIEDLDPTDTETGFQPQATLDIKGVIAKRWALRGRFNLLSGSTRYDGGLQGDTPEENTPYQTTTNNFILDSRETVGYVLYYRDKYSIIPYLGFGLHYWQRDITGPYGYVEQYLFYYLPVGVRSEIPLSEAFTLEPDISFMWNLGGSITILQPPDSDATGPLSSAYGIRLEVPLLYHLNRSFSLCFAPFFEYFGIGGGDWFPSAQGLIREPASSTYFYGLRAGGTFHF